MNYNFSSSPRVGSCIPTRTACTTDPRYHHNFDPRCHNHFNLHRHDHCDPCCDELELNIQLPDVKIPPCPDVKCPDIPACPECPACPEPKKPIDFSKLAILVNPVTGEILDAVNKESTGKIFKECQKIIEETKNDLEIGPNNKLIGGCDSDASCKACVDAINSSISDSRKVTAFFSEEMSAPEYNTYII